MFVVEKKLSRNPIPFEYGFSNKKDAEKFQQEIEQNPSIFLRWTDLKEKEKFDWPKQSKFVR